MAGALAEQFHIRPGDEVTWLPAGESLRLLPARSPHVALDPARRLKLFDAATARQKARDRKRNGTRPTPRGWTCEELYDRGLSRRHQHPRLPNRPAVPPEAAVATSLLREGLTKDSVRIPHQAVVGFVAAVTRPRGKEPPLLSGPAARIEAEELRPRFEVLYPTEALLRLALRGAAAYQLSWFDAHLWAYAEHYGLSELISEEFQDGRLYGTVTVRNPFG